MFNKIIRQLCETFLHNPAQCLLACPEYVYMCSRVRVHVCARRACVHVLARARVCVFMCQKCNNYGNHGNREICEYRHSLFTVTLQTRKANKSTTHLQTHNSSVHLRHNCDINILTFHLTSKCRNTSPHQICRQFLQRQY